MISVLLVRHLESEKNVKQVYSSDEDDGGLTEDGEAMGKKLAESLIKFRENNGLIAKHIYSSTASRALKTAEIIAQGMGLECQARNEFLSFKMGEYAGSSEKDLSNKDRLFFSQQELYRVGLYNSYDLNLPPNAEEPKEFEKRVAAAWEKMISTPSKENLKIFVLHRSPITAMLIHFARLFYKYPKDFYGFIKLDIGSISYLTYDKNKRGTIVKVNASPADLIETSY